MALRRRWRYWADRTGGMFRDVEINSPTGHGLERESRAAMGYAIEFAGEVDVRL